MKNLKESKPSQIEFPTFWTSKHADYFYCLIVRWVSWSWFVLLTGGVGILESKWSSISPVLYVKMFIPHGDVETIANRTLNFGMKKHDSITIITLCSCWSVDYKLWMITIVHVYSVLTDWSLFSIEHSTYLYKLHVHALKKKAVIHCISLSLSAKKRTW